MLEALLLFGQESVIQPGDIAGNISVVNTTVAMASHVAVVVNGYLHTFGGKNASGAMQGVRKFPLPSGAATMLAQMVNAKYIVSSGMINGSMYIYAGYNGTTFFNDLRRYDFDTNTWTLLQSGPSGRIGANAAVHGGKLYVFGGFGSSGRLNTMIAYDPASNTWSTKSTGPVARNGHALVTIGDYIYLFGGYDGNGTNYTYFKDTWRYDPIHDVWTQMLADGPPGRTDPAAFVKNGKFYIVGGTDSYTNSTALKDIWAYDPSVNSWSYVGVFDPIMIGMRAALDPATDKVYLSGGYVGSTYNTNIYLLE